MSEEIKAPCLQDQVNKVKKIIDRGLVWMFFAGVIGASCGGIFIILDGTIFARPIGLIIGVIILSFFVSFCKIYEQKSKEEYRKLLEQLQQTSNVSE